MADLYGVVHGDVSAELPGLFPAGFSAGTKPTNAQVTSLITTADTIVWLRVKDATGGVPALTDKAAVLAVRYIVEWVKAKVLQIVYTGNDPISVAAAVDPYAKMAKELLEAIDALGEQAIGTGEAAPRVVVSGTVPTRDLIITDAQLDASGSRERMF